MKKERSKPLRLYTFDRVIGNQHCINMLRRAIMQDTLPHFMIFHGIMGTGKSTCAEITSLAMTCKNTRDGSPCLVCDTCKSNISAIENNLKSATVAKINLGRFNTKSDVEQMIKEIFVLQSSERNCVYVLEEAHSLPASLQTSLLEEIDKIDSRTYVILCTTKINDLIPELRSRAILFPFKRLTDKESNLLLDTYLSSKNINMSEQTKNIIINYTRGIPRDTLKLTEFIVNNKPTLSEIESFLNYIDDSIFFNLFQTLKYGSIQDLHYFIESEVEVYDVREFISNFKEFYLKLFFAIEGNMNNFRQDVNVFDLQSTIDIVKTVDIFALGNMINKLSYNAKKVDVKFFLINLYQFLHDKKVSSIVTEKAKTVSNQKKVAVKAANEISQSEKQMSSLHAFSADSHIKYKFGGGQNKS